MDDIEFFSALRSIQLPSGFDDKDVADKGLILDSCWKQGMHDMHGSAFVKRPDFHQVDGTRLFTGRDCDVKLITHVKRYAYANSAFGYLSHREYLWDKKHDTLFSAYWAEGGVAELLACFSFSQAYALGAITPYPNGKWADCEETGRRMPPWSIDILMVDPALRSILK